MFYAPRKGRTGGGVAICTNVNKKSFISLRNTTFDIYEYEAIDVTTNKGTKFSVLCSYIPPEEHKQLEKLKDVVQSNIDKHLTVVMGDLNAKSMEWNNRTQNKSGEVVEQMISNTNLICVNDGQPTRRKSDSVIDIVLISPNLAHMMESCDTLTHEQVKSDHIAVLLNIDVCDEPNTKPPKPTWQTKKVNW